MRLAGGVRRFRPSIVEPVFLSSPFAVLNQLAREFASGLRRRALPLVVMSGGSVSPWPAVVVCACAPSGLPGSLVDVENLVRAHTRSDPRGARLRASDGRGPTFLFLGAVGVHSTFSDTGYISDLGSSFQTFLRTRCLPECLLSPGIRAYTLVLYADSTFSETG